MLQGPKGMYKRLIEIIPQFSSGSFIRRFSGPSSMADFPFTPKPVLRVTVKHGEGISDHKMVHKIRAPTSYVRITCENAASCCIYDTKVVKGTNPNWNETFTFVMPPSDNNISTAKLKISLYINPLAIFLGEKYLDTENYTTDSIDTKVDFGPNGIVHVNLQSSICSEPDFRFSLDLHEKEKEIAAKRRVTAMKAMEKFFPDEFKPQCLSETPVVAVTGSGGGYRAMTTYCGMTAALAAKGLGNMTSYMFGLSGSAWFLLSGLSNNAFASPEDFLRFKVSMKEGMLSNLTNTLFDIPLHKKAQDYLRATKIPDGQPFTFIDFYGFVLGHTFYKNFMDKSLCDFQDFLESAKSPYPVFTCNHVKTDMNADTYSVDVEFAPFEVNLPHFGVGVPTELFGSEWYGGIITKKNNPFQVHFFQGITGNVFGGTFDEFKQLTETDEEFEHEIAQLKKLPSSTKYAASSREVESSSNESNDMATAVKKFVMEKQNEAMKSNKVYQTLVDDLGQAMDNRQKVIDEHKQIVNQKIEATARDTLSDRGFMFDRTAKVHNVLYKFDDAKYFSLNKNQNPENDFKANTKHIPVNDDVISFVDAAVKANVPINVALRPQRKVDVLIVGDFSQYEADDDINYKELFKAEENARSQGLKFPRIDKKELAKHPLDEIHVFKDSDPDCPIVIWFTLSSKSYFENQSKTKEFDVFKHFPTMKLQYTGQDFEFLYGLSYYNTAKNIDVILDAIKEKVLQKKSA